MTEPEKYNPDVRDPAKRPSLDGEDGRPAERPVLGAMDMEGVIRIGIAILIFIVAGGAMIYFWNN